MVIPGIAEVAIPNVPESGQGRASTDTTPAPDMPPTEDARRYWSDGLAGLPPVQVRSTRQAYVIISARLDGDHA